MYVQSHRICRSERERYDMYLLRLHFTTVASTLMYYMLLSCRVRKGATPTTWGCIYHPRSVATSRRCATPTLSHAWTWTFAGAGRWARRSGGRGRTGDVLICLATYLSAMVRMTNYGDWKLREEPRRERTFAREHARSEPHLWLSEVH